MYDFYPFLFSPFINNEFVVSIQQSELILFLCCDQLVAKRNATFSLDETVTSQIAEKGNVRGPHRGPRLPRRQNRPAAAAPEGEAASFFHTRPPALMGNRDGHTHHHDE